MSNTSALSKIAATEKLEHKLHYAWQYCEEIGVQYSPIDSHNRTPWAVVDMVHAHGRYGKRSHSIKRIDAIHLVSMFLAYKVGQA